MTKEQLEQQAAFDRSAYGEMQTVNSDPAKSSTDENAPAADATGTAAAPADNMTAETEAMPTARWTDRL